MRKYYESLAREGPRVVATKTNALVNAVGAIAFIALLFSPELATNIAQLNWLGLPRWSAAVLLGLLIAYDLAVANHRIVATLIRESETAREEVGGLRVHLAARKRDQNFADELQKKYDYGVREILNHVLDTPARREMFLQRRDAWGTDVLNALRSHPCTPQEISSVEFLREFPLTGLFDVDPTWNREKQMVNERLGRLLAVINRYAGT